MPSDTVSIIVSTGIGISVIAGLVSGVCYVLAHGFSNARGRKSKTQWYCAICNSNFRSIEGVLDTEIVAACQKCSKRICKKNCSVRDPINGAWTCHYCLKNSSWFKEILGAFQSRYKKLLRNSTNNMKSSGIDEDIEEIRRKEKEQVRDFVERLVTSMLGGNVDDISITRMYNDEQYDMLFDRYHQDLSSALTDLGSALHISIANLPVVGQTPCTAHANLKQIIEKLLKDAVHLRSFSQSVEERPTDEKSRMYEDLLATAILNKVISNSQNNQPSSSAASVSSRYSTSSRRRHKKEYFLGNETIEDKWRNNDLETTSVSSLEEWLHSDSSLGSTKFVDRMSLTIQQHIEGDSPIESEDEEAEDIQETPSVTNENSNWYLQKRGFQSHSPVPVPMLVPNPTTDAKVLIGDKEIEDTSDLSDVASDFEASEPLSGVNSLLVKSKMIIGGKNPLSSLETSLDTNNLTDDEQSSSDSGVREDRSEHTEEEKYFKVTAVHNVGVEDENVPDSSLNSTSSKTEQDAEYTEKYVSLPIRNTLSPFSLSSNVTENEEHCTNNIEQNVNLERTPEDEIAQFEGCYSKKDKEKWKNPIEMKHNPYSKENIEKRIQTSKQFGRDYYTRQASAPSGTKNREKFIGDNWQNRSVDNDLLLVTAVPVILENDYNFEVTSDSDLSLVNCYDVENSKVYRKSSDGSQHEIIVKVNTEGLLYTPKDSEEYPEIVEEPKIEPEVNKKEVEIRKTVNSAGLLYNPKLCDVPQSNNKETEIRKSVNIEGLLFDPEECKTPTPEDEDIKLDRNQNLIEVDGTSTPDENLTIKIYTKVNTDGLLFNPEENSISDDIDSIIERDENYNAVITIPEAKPRHFSTPIKAIPVASKRNKVSQFKTEPEDTTDGFSAKPTVVTKKSDNTLIKKIYSNPVVRSFALTNRDQIPVSDYENTTTFRPPLENQKSFEEVIKSPILSPIKKSPPIEEADQVINSVITSSYSFEDFNVDHSDENAFSLEYSDSETLPRQGSVIKDPEITELKEKRLVASRLGEFSKSFPNLRKLPIERDIHEMQKYNSIYSLEESSDAENSTYDEPFQQRNVSVRDLRRLFENKNAANERPVHSLTARSISKQMRENLKGTNINNEVNLFESDA